MTITAHRKPPPPPTPSFTVTNDKKVVNAAKKDRPCSAPSYASVPTEGQPAGLESSGMKGYLGFTPAGLWVTHVRSSAYYNHRFKLQLKKNSPPFIAGGPVPKNRIRLRPVPEVNCNSAGLESAHINRFSYGYIGGALFVYPPPPSHRLPPKNSHKNSRRPVSALPSRRVHPCLQGTSLEPKTLICSRVHDKVRNGLSPRALNFGSSGNL